MSRKSSMSQESSRKTFVSHDFRSILKDTERNISSIKSRLEDKPNVGLSTPTRDIVHQYATSTPSEISRKYERLKYSPKQQSSQSSASETSLVKSLFKRLEEQTKTITHLTETVQVQSDELKRLKDRQNDLENRLRGNAGFNFDRKTELVQGHLQGEIDRLRDLIKNGKSKYESDYYNRDIKIQKRMIEDETDSIRREVESLKQRIMKIESDVSVSIHETHEFNRKFTTVERDVSLVNDNQRQLKRVAERREKELNYLKRELQDISDTVVDLNRQSYASNNDSKLKYSIKDQRSKFYDDDWLKEDELSYNRRSKQLSSYSADSPLSQKKKTATTYLDDSQLLTVLSNSSDFELSLGSLDGRSRNDNVRKKFIADDDDDEFAVELARLDSEHNKYMSEDDDLLNTEDLISDTKNTEEFLKDDDADKHDDLLSFNHFEDDDDLLTRSLRNGKSD